MTIRSTIILFLLCSVLACETDFETEVDGKTSPVVYALIDPQDEVHSVRLSRTFKGGGDAYLSAMQDDSIAYEGVEVKLEFYTETGWKYNEFFFSPVIEYNKDEGIFGRGGEQLFQLERNILDRFVPGTHLILNVRIPGQPDITSSLVKHLEPPRITAPRQGFMSYISLYPPNPVKVHFSDLAHFTDYDLIVRLHYTNFYLNGHEETRYADKIYHRYSSNSVSTRPSEIIVTLAGDNVYAALAQDIPKDTEVKYRKIGEMQFIVFTGSPEYYQYQYLNQMTTDLAGTPVTNLVNGIGVFAIKYHHERTGYNLDIISRDSLVNGRFTKSLKFVRW